MMKAQGYRPSLFLGAVAVVGMIGCGQEAPTGKTGASSTPAAPSKSVTDSTGQAIVDSVKTPLDKAHQVEGTLEKSAEKTAGAVKDAAQ
ncbi:MAG: hypothetical protein ACREJQ_07050 [bacterium]